MFCLEALVGREHCDSGGMEIEKVIGAGNREGLDDKRDVNRVEHVMKLKLE